VSRDTHSTVGVFNTISAHDLPEELEKEFV